MNDKDSPLLECALVDATTEQQMLATRVQVDNEEAHVPETASITLC